MQLKEKLIKELTGDIDKVNDFLIELKKTHPVKHPVNTVLWVDIKNVIANDYNPNKVPKQELTLLYKSIKADGFTQPIVCYKDTVNKKFIIVDGFHRYLVAKKSPDILKTTGGRVPITLIDKDINNRMASTVRHNRAKGIHSVDGMGKLIVKMAANGWGDEKICNEIGVTPHELARLKYVTGFAKIFEKKPYSQEWTTPEQVKIKKDKNLWRIE